MIFLLKAIKIRCRSINFFFNVKPGYKALISFSSILSMTCRGVQTNLQEQNGI